MNSTVLVTGADGFIGSKVVSALSSKCIVRAGVRSSISARKLESRFEIGEISSTTKWYDKLTDVNTVVHIAAVAHNNSDDPSYIYEVNVNGTINLAQQALKTGVKRFVFISSIGVLGSTSLTPFNEKSSTKPHSFYAESKLQAEKALLKIAKESELEVVIIRPVLVYGAGAPGNFGKLVGLVRKTPFLPFSLCENKRSFISIDNLVDFISVCINHPKAKNETFCISDRTYVSIREFTDGIAKGLNKKLIQLPIPVFILKLLGKMTGKSEMVEQLVGDLQVDSSKARELLDWIPPVTMDETLSKLRIKSQKSL
jgi:nucleoside-diphosphate-sugar epimerase